MAGWSEQLALGRLGPARGERHHVAGAQREAPAGRRAAAGDGRRQAEERRQVELVAAEAAWLEHAVEAGLDERGMRLLVHVAALLGRRLLVAQQRLHGLGAGDQFVWGEVWLGWRHLDRPFEGHAVHG
jgi:hypothetical protein